MEGIEPSSSAWKAEVLPLYHTRNSAFRYNVLSCIDYPTLSCSLNSGGGGRIRTFEACASDLQSDPFGHSGTPPGMTRIMSGSETLSIVFALFIKNLRLLCVFIYECEQSVSIHCNTCPSPTTRFRIASVNSVT